MNGSLERLISIPQVRAHREVVRPVLRAAKRVLRSPRLIVGEILAIALAGIVGASLPQEGLASAAKLAQLRAHGPLLTFLVNHLALDHVFRSAWFLTLALAASGSLLVVVLEQIRRLRVMWALPLSEAGFERAAFRAEFERPARLAPGRSEGGRTIEIRTHGRIRLAGSAILHSALLLVILAGAVRALFGVEAAVDLIEGEALAPEPSAWAAQWPGALARPFHLNVPLTLDAIRAGRYGTGELQDLRVQVSVQHGGGTRQGQIAINHQLEAPGGRLYLGSDFGPAALLEWWESARPPVRKALLLTSRGKGRYEGSGSGPGKTRVYLRAEAGGGANRPQDLEVRVVGAEGVPLLFTGLLRVGEEVALPGGNILKLQGLPFWARLRGSRDPSLWVAYVAFALALSGAVILFTTVKFDTCVMVTRKGDRERVFVALQSKGLDPLFEERFRQLVRLEGGPA